MVCLDFVQIAKENHDKAEKKRSKLQNKVVTFMYAVYGILCKSNRLTTLL